MEAQLNAVCQLWIRLNNDVASCNPMLSIGSLRVTKGHISCFSEATVHYVSDITPRPPITRLDRLTHETSRGKNWTTTQHHHWPPFAHAQSSKNCCGPSAGPVHPLTCTAHIHNQARQPSMSVWQQLNKSNDDNQQRREAKDDATGKLTTRRE